MLCEGQLGVGLRRVSVCCVRDRMIWTWRSECGMCVVVFVVGL